MMKVVLLLRPAACSRRLRGQRTAAAQATQLPAQQTDQISAGRRTAITSGRRACRAKRRHCSDRGRAARARRRFRAVLRRPQRHPIGRRPRIGLHRPRGRCHRHECARGERRVEYLRRDEGWHDIPGETSRRRRNQRSRGDKDRRQGLAGRTARQFVESSRWRMGDRDRQSIRVPSRQHGAERNGGRRERHRPESRDGERRRRRLCGHDSDRRFDQPEIRVVLSSSAR